MLYVRLTCAGVQDVSSFLKIKTQQWTAAQNALLKSMNLQGCSVPCWLLAEQLMWQNWAAGLNERLHSQEGGQILDFTWAWNSVSLKCTIQRYFNSRIQTISRGYLLWDAHQQSHFGWNTYIKMSRPGFSSQNESGWIMKENFESLIKQYPTRRCVLKWFFHS